MSAEHRPGGPTDQQLLSEAAERLDRLSETVSAGTIINRFVDEDAADKVAVDVVLDTLNDLPPDVVSAHGPAIAAMMVGIWHHGLAVGMMFQAEKNKTLPTAPDDLSGLT